MRAFSTATKNPVSAAQRYVTAHLRDPRVADQILTSASNLAAPMLATFVLPPREVGAIWITLGVYQLSVAVCRGSLGQPAQIAIGDDPSHAAPAPRSVTVIPVLLTAMTFAGGAVVHDVDLQHCLWVLACALPFLLLWDYFRHCAYALHRTDLALRSSALCVVLQLVGLTPAVLAETPGSPWLVAAWAVPGAIAGIRLFLAVRPYTRRTTSFGVPIEQRAYLALDALAGQLSGVAVPVVAGWVAGLATVGVFQNSRVLFRPASLVLNLVLVAGIPIVTAGVNQPARLAGTRALARRMVVLTGALTAVGGAGYVVLARYSSVNMSTWAVLLAAVESVSIVPYVVYALLAATMMRAGVLLIVRVIAVIVQVLLVLILGGVGAPGLAVASLAGFLIPAACIPWWVTGEVHRRRDSVAP